ncbi:MAG: TolB family protein [Armatimonadota bacterium]
MKRIVTWLLIQALALLMGLVGCGTGGNSSNVELTMEPNGLTVPAGEQRAISAQALQNGTPIVDPLITWSITGDIGAITQAGVFTATTTTSSVTPATGTIVVTGYGTTLSIPVTVTTGPLANIIVIPPDGANLQSVSSGASLAFTAVGEDSYQNRGTSRIAITPTWSVEGGIGTIAANGVFQATVAGAGRIIATVGDLHGAVDVVVVPGMVSSIHIIPPPGFQADSVVVNEAYAFTAVGEDSNGNRGQGARIPVQVTWSVQGDIGTIDASGHFTATTPGNGAIVATYGTLTDQLAITVGRFAGSLAFERVDLDHNLCLLGGNGTITPLTTGTNDFITPNWSPDGTRIVFVSQGAALSGICTINPDGGGASQLYASNGLEPACSHDGSLIAISTGTILGGQIDIITSAGAYVKKVAASSNGIPHSPSWSPNDGKIAYYIRTGIVGMDGVYVVDMGNPTSSSKLYQGSVQCVRWAPNPDYVSFSVGSRIYAYSLSGAAPELLVEEDAPLIGGFTWAPDGHAIVYAVQVNGLAQLRMKSLVTLQTVQLTNLVDAGAINPSWKP